MLRNDREVIQVLNILRTFGVLICVVFAAQVCAAEEFQTASANHYFSSGSDSDLMAEELEPWSAPLWKVRAGAAFLSRSNPSPGAVAVPTAGPGTIANAGDYSFNFAGGPDVSVTRLLSTGRSVEFRFLGAFDWNSNFVDYGAVGNFRLGSFSNFGATDLTGSYSSTLNSGEINWHCPLWDRFTFLAGFRTLQIHDFFRMTVTFPSFSATYNWNVDNHLYGGQFGGTFHLWELNRPFALDCTVKAGAFGNSADSAFNLRPSAGGNFPGGARNSATSFVGEIGLNASYQLTKHFAVRGGYQLLWVDGVSLASDQAISATKNSNLNIIDITSDLFYHGATAGFELSW